MAGLVMAMMIPSDNAALADVGGFQSPPPPVLRARWSEDWSTAGSVAVDGEGSILTPGGLRQPFKHLQLGDRSYLSLGGEARLAYEQYDAVDMGISDIGRQDALELRLALHADLHLNPRWRMFGELGFATVDDREGGAKSIDETAPDIWQLFVDYSHPVGDEQRLVWRFGRQIIETANTFITAGEAHNIRLVYNGARVAWVGEDLIPFEAFAAEYVDYADGSFDMSGTGEYFWGIRVGTRHQESQLDLNLLYLGWDLKDRQFEQGGAGRHDETRHTLMLWINRPLVSGRQWGLDYYLAYQSGEYQDRPGNSDIHAYAAFGELTYALHPEASTPVLGLKTSYFSGDSDPVDDELNTFYDHVFGTPYFGYARDIMPFNLMHVQPSIGYRFGNLGMVKLSHGLMWRADREDAYYGSANGITSRAEVSDSRWLGQQTELAVRIRPSTSWIISGYLAHFFAGDVIKDADGDDRNYAYVGIHYLF